MVKTREDLTGKRFGKLVVIEQDEDYISPKGDRLARWICQCDCGNKTSILGSVIKNKRSQSCGCISKELIKTLTKSRYDLTGKRFGRLEVLHMADDYITNQSKHYSRWECKCDCGNIITVAQNKLIQGRTKSCGCLRNELTSKRRSVNLSGMRFGRLTAIKRDYNYAKHTDENGSWWFCECDCGGNKIARASSLLKGDCLSCGCMTSHGEDKIRKYLNENGINYKSQYWFNDLRSKKNRPLYFDFAICDKSWNIIALIEYQGIQHYKEVHFKNFGKMQRDVTDNQKREYCNKNKIPLFEIRYDDDILESVKKIFRTINI